MYPPCMAAAVAVLYYCATQAFACRSDGGSCIYVETVPPCIDCVGVRFFGFQVLYLVLLNISVQIYVVVSAVSSSRPDLHNHARSLPTSNVNRPMLRLTSSVMLCSVPTPSTGTTLSRATSPPRSAVSQVNSTAVPYNIHKLSPNEAVAASLLWKRFRKRNDVRGV
jgi:hypothetical protein